MSAARIVLLTLLCKLAVSTGEPLHPLSEDFINLFNKKRKWKAGRNFPADMSMEYIKQLAGTRVNFSDHKNLPTVKHDSDDIDHLPENFAPREKWEN